MSAARHSRERLAIGAALCLLALGGFVYWLARGPARPQPTVAPPATQDEARFQQLREKMVRNDIAPYGIDDARVLAAMESVPRHAFVPPEAISRAYGDHPLSIGYGQTISQPYVVALMTQLLDVQPGDRILEIGTGSGYQAAILAELTDQVYTIEIVEPLCLQAAQRLATLPVQVRCADGYYGWEEHAPYDGIIVTCAPDHIPQPLVQQLADGGRMVIPVGPPGDYQVLWLLRRQGEEIVSERIGGVWFVPLIHTP